MRLASVAVLLAACSFSARAPAGDDGGGGSSALIDDTAADFLAGSGGDGVRVDPGGVLEPIAYVRGGLRARAYDGKFISGTTASWADIEGAVAGAAERGVAFSQLPANWGGAHPTGLGLTADTMPDDNFTVLYDGELLVPAGDHTIDIDGDDVGALEIAETFVLDATGGSKSITLHEDADTWVPISIGVGEGTGNSQLNVRFDNAALSAAQTRARVGDEHGLLTTIYSNVSNTELDAGAALAQPNVNWGMAAPPFDLPGVTATYTARFMGQLRIDSDGTYTLATAATSADDSTDLFIDGHLVSRTGTFADSHPTSASLTLKAGWHGIVVELDGSQKNLLGGADPHAVTLATTIAGADGIASPIAADHLRPAVTSGYFALAFTASTPLNDSVVAGGVTTLGVPVSEPAPVPGAVIDSAAIGYFYRHAAPTDYAVTLDMAGTTKMLPSTDPFVILFGDETAAGKPVPTTANAWSFTFTDSVPGDSTGNADPSAFGLVEFTTHGGPQMPFEPDWHYVSSPHDLGDGITAWGPLTVTANLQGAALSVSLRSAATEQDLATAAFVDVASGAVPTVPVNRFVQYELHVTGDGWQYPTIDKIVLPYTR